MQLQHVDSNISVSQCFSFVGVPTTRRGVYRAMDDGDDNVPMRGLRRKWRKISDDQLPGPSVEPLVDECQEHASLDNSALDHDFSFLASQWLIYLNKAMWTTIFGFLTMKKSENYWNMTGSE